MGETNKIYIGGASADMVRVSTQMALARERGLEVTYDWPEKIRADGGVANEGHDGFERYRLAKECLQGVRDAYFVWLMGDGVQTIGMWVELGYALALRKPVVLSGGFGDATIFGALTEEFRTHHEALNYIVGEVFPCGLRWLR